MVVRAFLFRDIVLDSVLDSLVTYSAKQVPCPTRRVIHLEDVLLDHDSSRCDPSAVSGRKPPSFLRLVSRIWCSRLRAAAVKDPSPLPRWRVCENLRQPSCKLSRFASVQGPTEGAAIEKKTKENHVCHDSGEVGQFSEKRAKRTLSPIAGFWTKKLRSSKTTSLMSGGQRCWLISGVASFSYQLEENQVV